MEKGFGPVGGLMRRCVGSIVYSTIGTRLVARRVVPSEVDEDGPMSRCHERGERTWVTGRVCHRRTNAVTLCESCPMISPDVLEEFSPFSRKDKYPLFSHLIRWTPARPTHDQ